MRNIAAALMLCLAALALVPVVAGTHIPTTGTQLNLIRLGNCSSHNPNVHPADATFAASTDFFVRHGWVIFLDDLTPDQQEAAFDDHTRFDLLVDNALQDSTEDAHVNDGVLVKTFVTNFPGGMTGTHTFRGIWYLNGLLSGGEKGTAVFQLACAAEVTFV